jgi:homoserine O-acetyltransferase/O-succinyltransferase
MQIPFQNNSIKILTFFLLIFSSALYSFNGKQQFAFIGDFKLENGETILNCKIGYRTYGEINNKKNNIILFPSWFGGNSESLQGLLGADRLLDTSKFFVITIDALGDGISSSPSNSSEQPENNFPRFTMKDIVNSQHKALTENLGIDHLYGIIGGSMGGMQVFEWIVSYPDFIDKALPYVGSPRVASSDLLLWNAELNAIKQGHQSGASEESILKTVALIQTYAINSLDHTNQKINRDSIHLYFESTYKIFKRFFRSYDWASQLNAMIEHNTAKSFNNSLKDAAEAVQAELLIIVSANDMIVSPAPAIEFSKYADAELIVLKNPCGHLAPGCEMQIFSEKVRNFFEKDFE